MTFARKGKSRPRLARFRLSTPIRVRSARRKSLSVLKVPAPRLAQTEVRSPLGRRCFPEPSDLGDCGGPRSRSRRLVREKSVPVSPESLILGDSPPRPGASRAPSRSLRSLLVSPWAPALAFRTLQGFAPEPLLPEIHPKEIPNDAKRERSHPAEQEFLRQEFTQTTHSLEQAE